MKVSVNGINIIKAFEGCKLKSYKAVPTEDFYTIGYGHYGVQPNLTITETIAFEYLMQDLVKAERSVNMYQSQYQFNQNQFDALVSFAFNIGSINQLTAGGKRNIEEISKAIPLYCKAGGKTLPGLAKRRTAEKELFDNAECSKEKTASQLAVEVLQGKWGNGESRKIKLEKAGYVYKEVQDAVNELLKPHK